MSKNNSRLKKIEESLNIDNEEDKTIPIIMWGYGEDVKKYFKDDDEKQKYEIWRIVRMREEYKRRGLPIPLLCNLNVKGVQKYISLFREQKDLPQKQIGPTIFELTNYGETISEDDTLES